jgi:hypothetical protein
VSDLVAKKKALWERSAIRTLLELEREAQTLRGRLERGDYYLCDMEDEASQLNSHVMTFITLVDRSAGLEEAGI